MSDHTTTESTVKYSGRRQIVRKGVKHERDVWFTHDEDEAFRFARDNKGTYYQFLPDMWRILTPVDTTKV